MKISKQIKNIIYIVIIVIAVIVIIVLGSDYLKNRSNSEEINTEDLQVTAVKPKKDRVLVTVSAETIRDGLANMGILLTQEYYFTQVERYTKEKDIISGLITASSEFMYSYEGSVMAGIDFEKISISKDENAKTITVDLPESEIQTVSIDKDTFKIYSEKESIWNPLKLEDYNLSLAEFEKTAKQKALDSGILERSDEQAQSLVMNFIRNFPSTSDYKIQFE